MTENLAEILAQQNKLIQLLIQQQEEAASKPSDLSKQSIQFDFFNPKEEKFDCYLLWLENFSALKKLNRNSFEIDKAKSQILINSIGTKYIQLVRNALHLVIREVNSIKNSSKFWRFNLRLRLISSVSNTNSYSEHRNLVSRSLHTYHHYRNSLCRVSGPAHKMHVKSNLQQSSSEHN